MIYMKHWVHVRQRDLKIWPTHLLTLEGDKDRFQWLNETVTWIPKCRISFTFEFLPLSLSNPMALKQGWFLPLPSGGGQFLPMSGAIFSHHTQGMLLASRWWSWGYCLISYNTKKVPTTKNYPAQNVNGTKVRSSELFPLVIRIAQAAPWGQGIDLRPMY